MMHPAGHITLEAMTPEIASGLAEKIAAIDPWHRLAIPPDHLRALFTATPASDIRLIARDGQPAGAIVIQPNWLLGPYLKHLSVLPEAQRNGAGAAALAWLEDLARSDHQTNIWLCVSAFNHQAEAFYRRHGFTVAATLPDLVRPGEDEVLMRRQLND